MFKKKVYPNTFYFDYLYVATLDSKTQKRLEKLGLRRGSYKGRYLNTAEVELECLKGKKLSANFFCRDATLDGAVY